MMKAFKMDVHEFHLTFYLFLYLFYNKYIIQFDGLNIIKYKLFTFTVNSCIFKYFNLKRLKVTLPFKYFVFFFGYLLISILLKISV